MFLLNLTAGELFSLFAALGGLIAALYLLDKAKQQKLVSTLRFWTAAMTQREQRSRRRLRDPWSLTLQLLGLFLLLLAIGRLEWGTGDHRSRDHVLLLDTSSWTAENSALGTLLDREKEIAQQYLSALPARDRVMLVRVDGLVTPATPFTSDRRELETALLQSRPSFLALKAGQALSFARRAQSWSGGRPGDITYVGPRLIAGDESLSATPPNLRILPVEANREHCGIRGIDVKKSDEDAKSWQATVVLKNFGSTRKTVRLNALFAGTRFAPRSLLLNSGEERSAEFNFSTTVAGDFVVQLEPSDNLPIDGRAVLHLPSTGMLRLAVFTTRSDLLKPLLNANHRLQVVFFSPGEYIAKPGADVMLLDHVSPEEQPGIPALWIAPSKERSPLPLKAVVSDALVKTWHPETVLAGALHARETRIPAAEVFHTFDGDLPVSSVAEGPIIVARPANSTRPRTVVMGFDPFDGQLKYQITTPLLFANLLSWLSPEALSAVDFTAGPAGAVTLTLDPDERGEQLRVSNDQGDAIPFTVRNQTLKLFTSSPGIVRIASGKRERMLSLTLPDLAEFDWKPRESMPGLPVPSAFTPQRIDPWKWLAVLAGFALTAEWILFGRRRTSSKPVLRYLMLAMKGASLVAILFALAEPTATLPETKTGAVILADTSASITRDDLVHASSIISEMERHKHGNWMKVIPFARETRTLRYEEVSDRIRLVNTPGNAGNGTDFEAALMDGLSAIPAGYVPQVVLISDGNENEGSTSRAVAELARLHVPVHTIPLAGRSESGLRLVSVSMPRGAYSGEQIPIDLTLHSPQSARGTVEVFAGDRSLGGNAIELETGANTLRVHARVKSAGTIPISGKVSAPGLGELRFEDVVQLRRARVLYISEDPPGTELNLLQALSQADFEVTRDPSLIDRDPGAIQLVILNNIDLNSLSAERKNRLEEYVKNGGGLLLIGGERQLFKDDKQMDALDRVLPAKLAPPKTYEGTCVGLIIDKSSSMEGRKIELARLSAIGVIDHLRPTDKIGVLIFDNSYQWAVPIRRAEDKSLIKRLISGITPDGGTQIAPALAEAYHKVLSSNVAYRHIVLLTDGISEEGDSIDLAREALDHQVTISTVGLGQDVNRSYLEKVAATSGGRSYFLNDPQGLEQILLKDVIDYSGSTTVEKRLKAVVQQDAEILNGVGIESAPPLKGYARFSAKPEADTILAIDGEKKDPLYIRWQYGLGRVAIFTSDAKSRWAEAWVTWPGFDKLWINISRDLLAHIDQSEARTRFDSANGDLLVSYRLGSGIVEPAEPPQIFVLGPKDFEQRLFLQRIGPRAYQGRLHIGRSNGLFLIRPAEESAAFPETALYRAEEELQDRGSDRALLQRISSLTGGRFNPPPDSIFDARSRSVNKLWQLWPALLALAIALTIGELTIRKWRGLVWPFRRPRFPSSDIASPDASAPDVRSFRNDMFAGTSQSR
ncbi:MAG: VWA domain-containing protein [Acidobacteriaceae bacterium]|nr:VWA domain-containing protein [Acidobacteriaceae bacterium]MBV9780590.1 VWA domain-containing protein [Acidobacteriaceae bacterium]